MLVGLLLALLFSASQWINFIVEIQFCFVLVYFTAIAALAALHNAAACSFGRERARKNWLWIAASVVIASIATGTEANGLLVWPLLVILAILIQLPRRVVALLSALTTAMMLLYIGHYTAATPMNVYEFFAKILDIVIFTLAYLSSAIDEPLITITKAVGLDWSAYRIGLAAALGALGVICFLYAIAVMVREPDKATRGRVTILIVSAFIVASAGLTGIGRIRFSIETALTSRYHSRPK
jgi:peptidoglycan/LPS O-acetylase OafA/YrhL